MHLLKHGDESFLDRLRADLLPFQEIFLKVFEEQVERLFFIVFRLLQNVSAPIPTPVGDAGGDGKPRT